MSPLRFWFIYVLVFLALCGLHLDFQQQIAEMNNTWAVLRQINASLVLVQSAKPAPSGQ